MWIRDMAAGFGLVLFMLASFVAAGGAQALIG
jgi:hypothetical protein